MTTTYIVDYGNGSEFPGVEAFGIKVCKGNPDEAEAENATFLFASGSTRPGPEPSVTLFVCDRYQEGRLSAPQFLRDSYEAVWGVWTGTLKSEIEAALYDWRDGEWVQVSYDYWVQVVS